jgi:hypothetical protein
VEHFSHWPPGMKLWTCLLVIALAGACGGSGSGGDEAPGSDDPDAGPSGDRPDARGCVGLECFQVDCSGGGTTSLSGTVYAPNGTLPLYNATVYVPNGPVSAFDEGVTCDRCGGTLSGNPLVQTTTDTSGNFTLTDVPATGDVPVVIQIGRWRRQIVVPAVDACADTPLDAGVTRLPRNKSEGDIPLMALTTGGADALECLLRKVGIDDAEFTVGGGTGRVHLYAGTDGTNRFASGLNAGARLGTATELWNQRDDLAAYDVVFLSCEGGQFPGTKSAAARQALFDYTNLGGRVFASHWHNYWIQEGPAPWSDTTSFDFQDDLNEIEADIDVSDPRGRDLAQWLVNVMASTTLGKIDITAAQHTVTGVDPELADRLIYKDETENDSPSVQYLTFTTPLDQEEDLRCGRVVFSDIHVSSGDVSNEDTRFPDGCRSDGLSPQEKVLAFMIFDIAACIGPGPVD